MGQEFFINSQELENKIRQLLPSQGGAGAGFDLSASTQIVPIIDLTESAEGSNVRVDLQTAISFKTATVFSQNNGTATIINTTGYWRIFGSVGSRTDASTQNNIILINDGPTDKNIFKSTIPGNGPGQVFTFDFIIKLEAGQICKVTASNASTIAGSVRQIADVNGNLTDP